MPINKPNKNSLLLIDVEKLTGCWMRLWIAVQKNDVIRGCMHWEIELLGRFFKGDTLSVITGHGRVVAELALNVSR